jgi:hypothetical protein
VVTDPGNDRLQIFNSGGDFEGEITVFSQTCGGVAIGDDRILLAIPTDDRVQVFDMGAEAFAPQV